MSVSLTWLFEGIAALPANDAHVEDLTLDSREVRAGSLFLALRGRQSHGLEHAAEAAARGARAVLWEPSGGMDARAASPPSVPASVFAAPVAGLQGMLGRIADRFFGRPSAHLRVVGITGTNGKTTCAYLLAECLGRLNSEAAYLGTIGWGRLASLHTPTHTTPDVISVHRQLAALRAAGVRDVSMEVSSHALDQGRVDGVRFFAAAFTNLTRDHLDYHASMQAYGAAKARLFSFADLKHAVINVGDAFGRECARGYSGPGILTAVWVGASQGVDASQGGAGQRGEGQGHAGQHVDAGQGHADWDARRPGTRSLYVRDVALDLHGISLSLDGSVGRAHVTTKLLGRFNAENSVIVLACLAALDVPLAAATAALADCTPPPGRMEVIEAATPGKPLAVVDYAHTPDALAKALGAAREHCRGLLWCVFGCGGDRDSGKRPLMGAIADELADRIIVTDDNPRSEDPHSITSGILQGITRRQALVIHDRGEAIATALRQAAANDMVLIAGKGHEDYQIYGATRRSFSDRHEAVRILGAVA